MQSDEMVLIMKIVLLLLVLEEGTKEAIYVYIYTYMHMCMICNIIKYWTIV